VSYRQGERLEMRCDLTWSDGLIDKANITKISQTKKFIFTFFKKSYRQKKNPNLFGLGLDFSGKFR
jgi:hypothetical protein